MHNILFIEENDNKEQEENEEPVDDWDDTIILSAFHDAITSHRTKKDEPTKSDYNQRINNNDKSQNKENTTKIKDRKQLKRKNPSNNENQVNAKNENKNKSFKCLMQDYVSSKQTEIIQNGETQESADSEIPSSSMPTFSGNFDQSPNFAEPQLSNINPLVVTPEMENEAMQNMLMAWYHSGYATGRYDTLRQLQQMQIQPQSQQQNDNIYNENG